jgi:hypothetical protein
MRALLTGIATGAAIVIIIAKGSTLLLVGGLYGSSHDEEPLPPPMRAPLYLPGERETAAAQSTYDHCISVAKAFRGSGRRGTFGHVRNSEFLACYICELEVSPRRLCDTETRNRLIRYTRGYFGALKQRKAASPPPPMARMVEMQRELAPSSAIVGGDGDFAPDPRILEGLEALKRDGALPADIEKTFEPEAPQSLIKALTRIQPEKALCT